MTTAVARPNGNRARRNPERDAEIMRLRREGVLVADIADRFGISIPRVCQIYSRALKELPAADIEEHRREQGERLDGLMAEAFGVIQRNRGTVDSPGDDELVLNAIRTINRLLDSRARLFGMNAPERTEIAIEQTRYEIVGIEVKELS